MSEAKKEHYALFSCDAWKSRDSMRFIGVFTRGGLDKAINKNVKSNGFQLEMQEKAKDISIAALQSNLKYGHIETVKINEEL